MERPDELNEEQLARLEAEEVIQDELVEYIPLISRDVHESNAMIAEIMELAIFTRCRDLCDDPPCSFVECDKERISRIKSKCLEWFDLMIERQVHTPLKVRSDEKGKENGQT